MTNPIGINNLSQSSNIANATGDEVVSLDKHINTSATDTHMKKYALTKS